MKHGLSSLLPLLVFLAFASLTSLAQPAHAAEIDLQWNHSSTYSVDGYRVYWGTSSRSYTQSYDVGLSTHHTIYDLEDQTRYYFAVTAYDGGVESGFSNEVSALAGIPDTGSGGGSGGASGGGCALDPDAGLGLEWLLLLLLPLFLGTYRNRQAGRPTRAQ
jgi:hypothetical protein